MTSSNDNVQVPLVVVAVCTCRRPLMLERCLDSLAAQLIDGTIRLEVVVVDNEDEPNNRPIVNSFARRFFHAINYVHEARRGIAWARNAALDFAISVGADFLAFIDDDEVAEPDWIAGLMAMEYRHIPVLRGRRTFIYPVNPPFWASVEEKDANPSSEGQSCRSCSTANVRFSMDLVTLSGLRFDTGLGHMGGEDIKFFSQAHALGYRIAKTNLAITHETAHSERLTFFGQMYREYCSGATSADGARLRHGAIRGVLSNFAAIVAAPIGAIEVCVSPVFLIAGTVPFKRRVLSGGKKIAKACGRIAALAGTLPKPYQVIVGH